MKTYVVIPHQNRLNESVLMWGHKICFYGKNLDNYPEIIPVIPSYLELVVVVVVLLFTSTVNI